MKGEFLCVVCPNGCVIEAEFSQGEREKPPKLTEAVGHRCSRGLKWVRQEIENPMRTIATSVPVRNGNSISASVRTTKPIPLAKVMDVMDVIRRENPEAPLRIGQVLLAGPAGTDTEIVVTRNVDCRERKDALCHD